jgi:hypothetical protein
MSVWVFAGGLLGVLAGVVFLLCVSANGWPRS